MSESQNPVGKPPKGQSILRTLHVEFIGQAAANSYNAPECHEMLLKEFPSLVCTLNAVKWYFRILRERGGVIDLALKDAGKYDAAIVDKAISQMKTKSRARLTALFHAYFAERQKIAEDPSYGITFADKRRRALKIDQNIRELDEPKTTAKGSYPTSRQPDGSMTFQEFEIANKDHAEQRKHLEAMRDEMGEGASGDVIININDRRPSEELNSEAELERKKKLAEVKIRKDAGKDAGAEPKENE